MKNRIEKQHCNTFGTVVHVQTRSSALYCKNIRLHVLTFHSSLVRSTMPQRIKRWRLLLLHIWLLQSTMLRWMKRRRLLTILIWHVDLHGLLTRDVDDDGQRGEAEDEECSMSDTSILCTHDRDFLIPIKANQPITKSQCY